MNELSGIDRARAALESGRCLAGGLLSSLVSDSWERCRDRGLRPSAEPADVVIPFPDVHRLRDQHGGLRRLALAEMHMLYSQIAGSNFMIALADPQGVVIDTMSDRVFADSRAGQSIIPGSVWNEGARGTNALGLSLVHKAPIAIHGREHYFSCHSHLSCMATPILDAAGSVVGLLDASCSYEGRQQHTHALVSMAAAQIENGLIYQERPNLFIFAFHPRAEYLDTLSAGLVAVSRDGELSALNRPARAMLAGLPAAIGCHFEDVFESRFSAIMDGVLGGGIINIRDRAGSGVFMVCRQIGTRAPSPSRQTSQTPITTERRPKERSPHKRPEAAFICNDPSLQKAMQGMSEATGLRLPIHIRGETGTGKELMARHVHKLSGRKGEFVALNCGAVPESLFISEIFGHERGAYTNARNEGAPGLARVADGGTLFFDEVADIPPAVQTVLLRFLDNMEVRAVGGQKTRKVDVQIVSATNQNLLDLVHERRFRADLLYRLNALTIEIPPLHARSDFAAIVHHLLEKIAPETMIGEATIERLRHREWPGNIRELQSVLQRMFVLHRMDCVDDEDTEKDNACCAACAGHLLSEKKCREIRSIFKASGGNISETSRLLSLSRTTVYKHIR